MSEAQLYSLGTAGRSSFDDTDSKIQRVGSETHMGLHEGNRRPRSIFSDIWRRISSWKIVLMRNIRKAKKRHTWKKLLKEARISRGKKKAEDKEELIEIDPQILSKLVEAPSVSKGKAQPRWLWKLLFRKGKDCISSQRKQQWKS